MAKDMVAELILKLDDQIRGPLGKLTEQLDELRSVAAGVQMDGLRNANEAVEGLGQQVSRTTGLLERMGRVAKEIGGAFATMGAAAGQGLRNIGSRAHAFGEAGSNLVNKGFGAAAEGFAVYEPIKEYAERDKALRQQALMEGLHGAGLNAEIARLNTMINADALATGQSSASITEARFDLLGQGLAQDKVDSVLRAHSEAATAYNISAAALGPVTGAILGNLGVSGTQNMEGALAAVAAASQQGRVKIPDMANALPGLTGVAAGLGMRGRGSLDTLLAGLEISAKTASDGVQAGYHFHDLLEGLTSFRMDHMAQKRLGIDINAELLKGEKAGKNPLDVYLGVIKGLTAGKTAIEQQHLINSIVGQQGARASLLALIQHNDEFEKLRKTLTGISQAKLKVDLTDVTGDAATQIQNMQEGLHQVMLTLGQGFMPVLTLVAKGLLKLNDGLTYLNKNFPQATYWVLAGIAGFLALGAAITLLGAVVPVFTTGLALIGSALAVIFSPLFLFSALMIGIAADIYEHWSHFAGFFRQIGAGMLQELHGIGNFIAGVFTLDFARALGGIKQFAGGMVLALGGLRGAVTKVFVEMWGHIKTVFADFVGWVDGWAGGLATRILEGITSNWGKLVSGLGDLIGNLEGKFDNSWIGRHIGLATQANTSGIAGGSAIAAGAPGANGTVTVRLQAEPGTRVTAASSSGNISVQPPNRGATVSRP